MPDSHHTRPRTSQQHRTSSSRDLCQAWIDWRTRQPSLIGVGPRQAATALRVPEAILLSTLCLHDGTGIRRLRPDLITLLAPATSWAGLQLEIPHPLGLLKLPLQARSVQLDRRTILLQDGKQQVLFATPSVAHCFLVTEPADSCPGMHWFDQQGDLIARLRLRPDTTAAQAALARWQELITPRTDNPPVVKGPANQYTTGLALSSHWCQIEQILNDVTVLNRLGQAMERLLGLFPDMTVTLEAWASAVSYRGPVMCAKQGEIETEVAGQLTLFRAPLTQAQICLLPDGQPLLRLRGASGGLLGLTIDARHATTDPWLHALLATRHHQRR